jgi:hypothetical protein
MRLSRKLAASLLFAVAASGLSALPSTAASVARLAGGPNIGTPGSHPQVVDGQTVEYAPTWSGYAVTGGTFTTATASWTQNAITCTPLGETVMSPWVGIDGYSDNTVEQIGSSGDCDRGKPDYYAWYEMYPSNPVDLVLTVDPGDHFTGTVTHSGGESYVLNLQDITQGWTYKMTAKMAANDNSAEAIMEMPGDHLSKFGTDPFSGFTVDGEPIGSYTSSPYTVHQMDIKVNGTVCDSTSALSNNDNFTTTWLNHCS